MELSMQSFSEAVRKSPQFNNGTDADLLVDIGLALTRAIQRAEGKNKSKNKETQE